MKKTLLMTAAMLMTVSCGETGAQTPVDDDYNPDKWEYVGPDAKKAETTISKPVAKVVTPTAEEREWIDSLLVDEAAAFPNWGHRFPPVSRSITKDRLKDRIRGRQLLAIIIYNLRYDSYDFLCSKWSDDEAMMGQAAELYNFDAYALKYRNADILKELEALEPKMKRISKKELYCDKVEALGKAPGSITEGFIAQYKIDHDLE